MEWYTEQIEKDWRERAGADTPRKLFLVFTYLDAFRRKYENKHITITSFVRDISKSGGNPSYHPLGRAGDIRTRDMSKVAFPIIYAALKTLIDLLNTIYPESELQAVIEKDHIHIEDDNGNPEFPKT